MPEVVKQRVVSGLAALVLAACVVALEVQVAASLDEIHSLESALDLGLGLLAYIFIPGLLIVGGVYEIVAGLRGRALPARRGGPPPRGSHFALFTLHANRAMGHAYQVAMGYNHEFIGTEHMLLGILQRADCTAVKILSHLGVSGEEIRGEIERIVVAGPSLVTLGNLPFTPRGKVVLELTMAAADRLEHPGVGTEHLLLGLAEEKDGVAGQVLRRLGATREDVEREIRDGHQEGPRDPA